MHVPSWMGKQQKAIMRNLLVVGPAADLVCLSWRLLLDELCTKLTHSRYTSFCRSVKSLEKRRLVKKSWEFGGLRVSLTEPGRELAKLIKEQIESCPATKS